MLNKLYNLSTGVGSLPHTDQKKAIDLIKNYFPAVPHWPQLPNCSNNEGLIQQYLSPLIKSGLISIKENGNPFFNTDNSNWTSLLTSFYEQCFEVQENSRGLDYFAFPRDFAIGFYSFLKTFLDKKNSLFVKGQITGPVTIGLQVVDSYRRSSFYQKELRELLTKTLALQTKWQIQQLKLFSLPILLVIDEPGIYAFGQSNYIALSRDDIKESLCSIVDVIHNEGEFAGVHCCAGVDWSIFFDLFFDVVNFDAYNYFPSMLVYSQELERFLYRGGCLAWGIVPTSPEAYDITAENIIEQLFKNIKILKDKGVSEEKLRTQLMITPSCGAGALDEPLAEHIYKLTGEVCQKLSNK